MTDLVALTRWVGFLACLYALMAAPVIRILGKPARGLTVPLFLLGWSYLYWLWGSGMTLPEGSLPAWMTGILALLIAWKFWFFAPKAKSSENREWDLLVFFGALALGLYMRGLTPEIAQTEKYSDLSMLQAVTLDSHFPPMDRFFSGRTLNYYYFGYVVFAPLIRLIHIPMEWAFNLAVATTVALSASAIYSCVRILGGVRSVATWSATTLVLLSNAEWLLQVWNRHGFHDFSWWTGSRVIPGTINEFPFFSLVVGDLHAHFLELPWLALAFAAALLLKRALVKKDRSLQFLLTPLCALAVGLHYATNSWGLPVAALGTALILWESIGFTAIVGLLSYLFFLPFWMNYEPPVGAFHWLPRAFHSSLGHFLLHWGLFLAPLMAIVLPTLRMLPWKKSAFLLGISLMLGAVGGGVAGLLALLLVLTAWTPELRREVRGVLGLGLFLLIFCEMIYVKDPYSGELLRMNTVFKFHYLAWWLFSATIPILVWSRPWLRKASCVLVAVSLVYPVMALRIFSSSKPMSLDGMRNWPVDHPGEREAIDWIRAQTHPADVVLEAPGEAYDHRGRVSAFSGRPAPLGWTHHERIWRGFRNAMITERWDDLGLLKREASDAELVALFRKYRVRWVFDGESERKSFAPSNLEWLRKRSTPYSTPQVEVHKVMVQ